MGVKLSNLSTVVPLVSLGQINEVTVQSVTLLEARECSVFASLGVCADYLTTARALTAMPDPRSSCIV